MSIVTLVYCVPLMTALCAHRPPSYRARAHVSSTLHHRHHNSKEEIFCRRHHSDIPSRSYATRQTISIEPNNNKSRDTDSPPPYPTRCSSRDAASVILNSTAQDGLLIISCDASGRGGGSKHDGLAAILRMRHGVSNSRSLRNVTYSSKDGEKKIDLMDVISRRRAPSRKSSGEVAAISLGMKRAMLVIPPEWRRKVLILSDSETALGFYCGGHRSSRDGQESHWRALSRLMTESQDGVFFSKIRSSSRGIRIVSSKTSSPGGDGWDNECIRWDGIGFVDHDAADYLSSATRSWSNSNIAMNVDISEGVEKLSFRSVCSLRPEDIAWLENSDDCAFDVNPSSKPKTDGSSTYWKRITVRGSDARDDRRRRSKLKQEMIMDMLGIGEL
ncbi:hypothetical protein HJC23_007730 [Cyclotella cryptica]|uniref:RNase H type-1 domain-containing protein n=1 Tax=Cyclotella cryptica TaxID=29204 RepID=A0ABD3PA75_9STRA|eukprot:CCRYP_016392-RA/>CCRYP_016392-RA protein AED:0.00 eAED:0.00 QI:274/1/1/1/0/0/2/233/386